jgi:hypothetical protein
MSEYQYFEFRTVDGRLDERQMRELRAVSSRASMTPTGLSVSYNRGDFGGDPRKLTARYFDAFFHYANWWDVRLIFRFPADQVDLGRMKAYDSGDDSLYVRRLGKHVLIDLYLANDDREEDLYLDEDQVLTQLLELRRDIIAGDYRCLYLGWLACARRGQVDTDEEPPVPPGLGRLFSSCLPGSLLWTGV